MESFRQIFYGGIHTFFSVISQKMFFNSKKRTELHQCKAKSVDSATRYWSARGYASTTHFQLLWWFPASAASWALQSAIFHRCWRTRPTLCSHSFIIKRLGSSLLGAQRCVVSPSHIIHTRRHTSARLIKSILCGEVYASLHSCAFFSWLVFRTPHWILFGTS